MHQVGIKLAANFNVVGYILAFIHAFTFLCYIPAPHHPAQNLFHCFAKFLSAKCYGFPYFVFC